MSPVGRLAVLRTTSKAELVRAIALITWPGLMAPLVGPPLGGFIATYASWRWIFFLNVPIGVAGMLLVARILPNLGGETRRPFDLIGFLLTAVALSTLLYGVEAVARGHGDQTLALLVIGLGLAAGLQALRHMRRHAHPILDLSTCRVPTFAAVTLWGGTLFRMTSGAMPYLLPLFFQIGFGMSAASAGLFVLAYAAGNLGMKTLTTPILRMFGFRRILVVNGTIAAATILACAALRPELPDILTMAILFAAGCFRSMQLTALSTLTFADVPDAMKSSATTLSTMSHQLSMTIGIAAAALVLSLNAAARGAASDSLAMQDFQVAFTVMAAIAAASALRFLMIERSAGAEVSGHR